MEQEIKRVYIAGKLNDDACGYIQNLHKMITFADRVKLLGFSVYVPCLDFLQGLINGNYGYDDYFNNSQPWLDASDAIVMMPSWVDSSGSRREMDRATLKGIRVFMSFDEIKIWKDEEDERKNR